MGRPKGSKNRKATDETQPTPKSISRIKDEPIDPAEITVGKPLRSSATCMVCHEPIGTDYKIIGCRMDAASGAMLNVYLHNACRYQIKSKEIEPEDE
jgi:hypothetical protein